MSPEVRTLLAWAEKNGWTVLPAGRGGHPRLRWHDGRTVSVPATPSDWRSMLNTRADMARISGTHAPRSRSPRYRHVSARNRFSMEAALAERDARHDAEGRRAAAREDLRQQLDEVEAVVHKLEAKRTRTPGDLRLLHHAKAMLADIEDSL